MDTFNMLDTYELEYLEQAQAPQGKRRKRAKKNKSCWREIERIKERRQLVREVNEYSNTNALDALEAAFS